MIARLVLVLVAATLDGPSEWIVEGVRIPARKLTVQRESKTTEPEKEGARPRADDVFEIMTDFGPFKLKYSRYLNRDAQGRKPQPACPTTDWGLGVSGFGSQWYYNNTIRVLLDGDDIVRRYAADEIDVRESFGVARVRFHWRLEQAAVSVHLAVVNERSEGFFEVAVEPRRPLKTVGVVLTCYPGGFGPYYGQPSRRVVQTAEAEASVATGEQNQTLALSPKCNWIWYADREAEDRGLYSSGSVALVLLPEEQARGEVQVSNYGVRTKLRYPGSQTRIRLGLAAYPGPNARAWRAFAQERGNVAAILRELEFWPKGGK